MNPNLIAAKIEEKAIELGFILVGLTKPESPISFPIYKSWVENKYHGKMQYLETQRALERRNDPAVILKECKTILVLGIPYSKPTKDFQNPLFDNVNIASYAWNQDYHDVLKPMIQELLDYLEEIIGRKTPNKWYTDTGPILERDFANKAGIGWVGKNSMLINPKLGSTFILAEILLGIDLPVNESIITDHCGSCTRCIEACPTQCILPNRTIDATQCISYLTIELKNDIPIELRNKIGNWAFGCDICQQVCPWNDKFAPEYGFYQFDRGEDFVKGDIRELFNFSPQQFNSFFKGSPIKRAKRRGILRNLAVVLGNQKNVADIPILNESINHNEPLVRQHVAWALGEFQSKPTRNVLQKRLTIEEDENVLAEIKLSLSEN
jgi:epoxyqueuosine reductase